MNQTISIETITPDVAKLYLGSNISNRRVSRERVSYLAEQMKSGEWEISNDAICFDEDGALINGQHRLLALIEYGQPLQFLVGRGYNRDVFTIMDTGKNRSAGDVFYINGVKNSTNTAAMVRRHMLLRKGLTILRSETGAGNAKSTRTNLNNKQLFEEYEKHRDLYDIISTDSVLIYSKCRLLSQSEISGIMAFLIIDMKKTYENVEKFFSETCSLKESDNKTLEALRVRLLNDKMNSKKMSPSYKQGLIIKAWNYYNKGRQVRGLSYDAENDIGIWFE